MRVIDFGFIRLIQNVAMSGIILCVSTVAGLADKWIVDTERSKLLFQLKVQENNLEGSFEDFQAQIDFDPENPASGSIIVDVETGSIFTGNSQGDGIAKAADWLASDQFPVARFESTIIEGNKAYGFVARGDLSIKGISVPVDLTFDLNIDGTSAVATGSATLSRTDFGVGGPVSGSLPVEDAVGVEFEIHARTR